MERVTGVLSAQFAMEHALKEQEVELIQQRMCEVKELLAKLRAAALLKHYGVEPRESYQGVNSEVEDGDKKWSGEVTPKDAPTTTTGVGLSASFSRLQSRTQSRVQSRVQSRAPSPMGAEHFVGEDQGTSGIRIANSLSRPMEENNVQGSFRKESRFYVQKRIVVGNTSRFIREDQRESNDQSTHKWMVYVRGPKEEPDIDHFISKVWFFLHPSYKPNDLVEVSQPPFHLTRRGWGEFPVRVRLFFHERHERGHKPVDIVHPLRLDRTYTGLQTLGAETTAQLELDRQLFSNEALPKSVTETNMDQPQLPVTTSSGAELSSGPAAATSVELSGETDDKSRERTAALLLFEHSYAKPISEMPSMPPVSLEQIAMQARLVPGMPGHVSVLLPRHQVAGLRPEELVAQLAGQLAAREHRPTVSLEQALMQGIRHFPLVSATQDRTLYPYVSSTTAQFLSWTLGKRQAAEWMRAIALKNHVICRLPESTPKPTTKQVLMWCRAHGHSQLVPASGSAAQTGIPRQPLALCGLCGRPLLNPNHHTHEACRKQCADGVISLSGSQTLLQQLTVQQHSKRHRRAAVVTTTLDVTTPCPAPVQCPSVFGRRLPVAIKRRPTTHHWVLDILAPVGLRSALATPSPTDTAPPHQVEVALATACRCMLRELLLTANDVASQDCAPHNMMAAPTLTVLHVHAALARTERFDFLTLDGLAAPP